jgi:hypothetical protein
MLRSIESIRFSAFRMKSSIIGCIASGYRAMHVRRSLGCKKHCSSFFCRISCWTCLPTFQASFILLTVSTLSSDAFFRFFMPATPVSSWSYILNLKITFLSNADMYRKVEYSARAQNLIDKFLGTRAIHDCGCHDKGEGLVFPFATDEDRLDGLLQNGSRLVFNTQDQVVRFRQ